MSSNSVFVLIFCLRRESGKIAIATSTPWAKDGGMSVDRGGFPKAVRCRRLAAAIVMALVGLSDGAFAQTPSVKDQSVVLTVRGNGSPAALKRTIDTLEAGGRTVILRIAGGARRSLPRRPRGARRLEVGAGGAPPTDRLSPRNLLGRFHCGLRLRQSGGSGGSGRTGRTRQGLGREPQRADGVAGLAQVDPQFRSRHRRGRGLPFRD